MNKRVFYRGISISEGDKFFFRKNGVELALKYHVKIINQSPWLMTDTDGHEFGDEFEKQIDHIERFASNHNLELIYSGVKNEN